jgi:HD-GYP domain-containing protein (c-di-GMP phosphodiesterase class II)
VLTQIDGIENIAAWASYHHERQDGNGYPFHIKGDDFPLLARVMAVADVMTALLEDRPYRLGMNREKVAKILLSMVENGGFDQAIVDLANNNFSRINSVRIKAQQEARQEYEAFHDRSLLEYHVVVA